VLEASRKPTQEARGAAMKHIVEEESGTYVRQIRHPHNGYFAGDFSTVPFEQPDLHFLHTLKENAA
jgi:hypothetical protein